MVGSISARLGARFDDADVTRFERRLIAVRRLASTPVTADLDANAVQGDFDTYESLLRHANAQADRGANADLDATVGEDGFNEFDQRLDQAQENAGAAGSGAGEAMGGGMLAKLKGFAGPIAAAGAAVAAIFTKAVGDAIDREDINSKLAAQLDLNPAEAKRAGALTGRIYANAYGESLEEVQGVVRSVVANLNMDLDDVQTERVSEKLLNLSSTFGTEADEVTRAINSLMQNGLADNVDQALDQITNGFQNGADRSGEFLDTLNEYAAPLAALGISAEDFTGIIAEGFDRGVYSADKLGDALKEFSIRAVDGSAATVAGYKAIGLNADETAEKIAKGGPAARKATGEIIDRVLAIKDATKRDAAGVAFFGSMWEDLKAKGIGALRPVKGAIDDVRGSADRMNKTLGDTDRAAITKFTRGVENGMVAAGASIINFGKKAKGGFSDFTDDLKNAGKDGEGTLGRLRRTFDSGVDTIKGALRSAKNAVRSVFGGEASGDVRDFGRAVQRAAEVAADAFSRIAKFASRVAKDALPELGQAFRGVLTVIRGVMKIVTGLLSGDWSKVMDGMLDIGRGALKTLGAIFKAAVNPIGAAVGAIGDAVGDKLSNAWNGAQRKAATFVNGLIGIINKIPGVDIGLVSVPQSNSVKASDAHEKKVAAGGRSVSLRERVAAGARRTLSAFREGGEVVAVSSGEAMRYPDGSWAMVPGPRTAADNVLTWAPYQTEVYTEDGIRRLAQGEGREAALRKQAKHFSVGGVLKSAASAIPGVGAIVETASSLVGKLPKVPDDALVGGALNYVKDKAVAYIKSKAASLLGGGMGDDDPAWNGILDIARRTGNVVTSGYRPGDDGWHGQNRAKDFAGGDMMAGAKAVEAKYGSRLLELIYTPLGHGIKNGKRISSFGAEVDADHFDHYHVAFRGGGLLRPLMQRFGGPKKAKAKKKTFNPTRQYARALTAALGIGKIDDFDPVAEIEATNPNKPKKATKTVAKTADDGPNETPNSTLGVFDRAYPRHITSSPTPGMTVFSDATVQALAKAVGLPTWFSKITRGESGNAPGIQQPDPGDHMVGYGLLQNTPNAWGKGSKAMAKFKQLGGISAMFVPRKNFQMGKFLYDNAASKTPKTPGFPWYGTQYLRAGGRVLQGFRKGGKLVSRVVKGSQVSNSGNEGVAKSVARAEKGIVGFEKKIQKLENDYSLTDREYSVETLDLFTENDDGSTTPNVDNINKRAGQLKALRDKRQKIIDTIAEYRKAIAEVVKEYKAAIKRLKAAIKATAGKSRAKTRAGYQATIDEYQERIGELGDIDSDLADDVRSSEIDRSEVDQEISEVEGARTAKPASPSTDSAGSGGQSFDDLLSDDERRQISEVERDESLANLTQGDATDDEAARSRGESLYRGILKRLQDSGASPEAVKAAADALGSYLPSSDASTGGSAADIARQAEAMLSTFMGARGDLLSQLGSNVAGYGQPGSIIGEPGSPLDIAAGGRSFGWRGTGQTGAQVVVEQLNQHYPQAPENPDAWKARVGFTTTALVA